MPDEGPVPPQAAPSVRIQELQAAADQAREAYQYDDAIERYSEALTLLRPSTDGNRALEFDLLAGRAQCHSFQGTSDREVADLDAMAEIAKAVDNLPRQIEVISRKVAFAYFHGGAVELRPVLEEALTRARASSNPALEAECLTALGTTYVVVSDWPAAEKNLEAARHLYQAWDNQEGEAQVLLLLSRVALNSGAGDAVGLARAALERLRARGDRVGESRALNALGISGNDLAQQRAYFEQALTIARAIGYRPQQTLEENNLGLLYLNLGLYGKGLEYTARSVEMARAMGANASLTASLDSLGRAYAELGAHEQARHAYDEGLALARR